MKVFVTGVGGQLGNDVMNELNRRGYKIICRSIFLSALLMKDPERAALTQAIRSRK